MLEDTAMLVYILSTYDAHGSENVKATLDKTKLIGMLLSYYPNASPPIDVSHEVNMITNWLSSGGTDNEMSESGLHLSRGWGGFLLHTVKLE